MAARNIAALVGMFGIGLAIGIALWPINALLLRLTTNGATLLGAAFGAIFTVVAAFLASIGLSTANNVSYAGS